MRCRFNESIEVAATYASEALAVRLNRIPAHSVVCSSPSSLTVATYAVTVTFNGQDFTHTWASFTVDPVAHISLVEPPTGPVRGGTRVILGGSGLAAGINGSRFCSFGEWGFVHARLVTANPDQLLCVTPEGMARGKGSVQLRATSNGQQFSGSSVNFTFFAAIAVLELSPTSGPTDGDTMINVVGQFPGVSLANINCSFRDSSERRLDVAATRLSELLLHCRTP
eukprot:2136290-Prymnesium_polylepis.1